MALNFNGINIGGTNSGGSSGTNNHSQLTNLDFTNSGHTGFMSDENYLPADTIITVETDGSGDFTTLSGAVSYLSGKWSNGRVTISIGSGIYNISSTIYINGINFNINELVINGNSNSNTILNFTGSGSSSAVIHCSKILSFRLNDIKIQKTTQEGYGLQLDAGTNYTAIKNVTFENCSTGTFSLLCDTLHIQTGNTFKNCTVGINSTRSAKVNTDVGSLITFIDIGTAWKVETGGMIAPSTPVTNITYTNVTTKCSQTVGQFTVNGFIGGTLQN